MWQPKERERINKGTLDSSSYSLSLLCSSFLLAFLWVAFSQKIGKERLIKQRRKDMTK